MSLFRTGGDACRSIVHNEDPPPYVLSRARVMFNFHLLQT